MASNVASGQWDGHNWKPFVNVPTVYTTPNYPTYVKQAHTDEERLRFALELIADGDLTHEVIKRIAAKALKREGS